MTFGVDVTDAPGKLFDDPQQELAYWRTLALNYRAKAYRASQQSQESADSGDIPEETDAARGAVDELHAGHLGEAAKTTELSARPSHLVKHSVSQSAVTGAIPKLNAFDGEDDGTYPYPNWRFDVLQLVRTGYSPTVVRMSIVRSCRGVPARVLHSLGQTFDVHDVIAAFDKRFASVATSEALMSQFYSATQKADESVNAWGCRLETILSQPQLSKTPRPQRLTMLREKFWRGLRSETVRNALRHRFDGGLTYDELLVYAREVEKEVPMKSNASKAATKTKMSALQTAEPSLSSQLADILKRLCSLEQQLPAKKESISRNQQGTGTQRKRNWSRRKPQDKRYTSSKKPGCFKCGKEDHFKKDCPHLNAK